MFAARLAILITCSFANAALGQPNFGTLIGSVDGDPIQFECTTADASGRIRCDFVQVLLSSEEHPEDLEKALATIPEILADADGSLNGMCQDYLVNANDALAKFEQGQTLEDGTAPPTDPEELGYLRSIFQTLDAMCRDRSSEGVEAFLRMTHERASKTFRPNINQ
jgi:hypothetical protein